ncbi:kinase-like domain-containing protein [Chaetomium sp. MPI-CAGE-AT-0009]|nr:kinase-like domain-containing protein [Chaetomium sp. MPI-CAGE-AT-0009]
MRSQMKTDEIEAERGRWVAALDDSDICRLASSFRGGDPCTIFRPRQHGAFNVCFFVEFQSPSQRWVVRIPIPTSLPKALLDEKTEIEVATMRYVSAKTTIPVPRVHAYAFSATVPNRLPYIIMDYVDGRNLKDLGFGSGNETWGSLIAGRPTPAARHLHRQLADVYVQLRQLEFPRIGALGLPSHDVSALTCDPQQISVCNRPLSIDIALQELDGLQPYNIFPPRKTLSTASEFVDGLLRLAHNKLDKEQDQNMDEDEPASILYAAHHFKRFVQDKWLDRSTNQGPFVLTHGDMENVISNLLFDKDYNLVGIVDWEWSRVVPVQFMVPPIWLSASQLDFVLLVQERYSKQVGYLRAAVQEVEKALGLPPRLSTEWAPLEKWCHGAIAIGLNYPDYTYLVYWDLIFRKLVPRLRNSTQEQRDEQHEKEVVPRVKAFIEASEDRRAFLERKIREQLEYFEAEKEHYGYKRSRMITKRIC